MSCESKIAGGGRPAQYTTEIGIAICERLCDGETLRAVCADPGMPDKATVRDWLARCPEFREQSRFSTATISPAAVSDATCAGG
jgi:hypothetical protein